MSQNDSETDNQNSKLDLDNTKGLTPLNNPKKIDQSQSLKLSPKWINMELKLSDRIPSSES